jgi:hypothetical protein
VSVHGRDVHLDDVAHDWPPATRPTQLVGARGPRTVALAGEVADGVLLDSIVDADAVLRDRATLDEARAASGRDGRAQVTVYTEVEPGAEDLTDVVRRRVAGLADAGADTVVLQGTHEAPDPRALLEAIGGLS